MAKNNKGLVFAVILIIGLVFIMLAFTEQTSANIAGEKASTCPNPQFAQNESATGSFICASVPVPYNYIINETGSTITAYPTSIGLAKYSGTDFVNVAGNASLALSNAGITTGSIFVKSGTYSATNTNGLNLKQEKLIGDGSFDNNLVTISWTGGEPGRAGLIDNFASLSNIALQAGLFIKADLFVLQNVTSSSINNLEIVQSNINDAGTGINVTKGGVFDSFINSAGLGLINGITIFGNNNQFSNINIGSGNPTPTVGIIDSTSGSNQFSQIQISNTARTILQLNSGVGKDIITNWLGVIVDNSGSTTNFACPISGDLPCGRTNIRVTSDQTNTANSAASTTLTYSLSINTNYVFTAQIFLTNTATSTANFQIHALPAGATLVMACAINGAIAVTNGECVTAVSTNIFGTALSGATATNIAVTIYGTITVGATAGTLQLDFLDIAALGTVTIKAGSFMTVNSVA